MKKQYRRRGLPKKGEHRQFVDLRSVLGKNRRVGTVFEGWVNNTMHTINTLGKTV